MNKAEIKKETNINTTAVINYDIVAPYMDGQFLAGAEEVCVFRSELQRTPAVKTVDTQHHENLIHSAEFL